MRPVLSFKCAAVCADCKQAVEGTLSLTSRLTVCDSTGFLIAGLHRPRVVCDLCASNAGMPGADEVITKEDLTDPERRERIIDRLARGVQDRPV